MGIYITMTMIRKEVCNGITISNRFIKRRSSKISKKVEEYVDIVEIGTPIVINEGLPAVQHLNENINNAKVLADLKLWMQQTMK